MNNRIIQNRTFTNTTVKVSNASNVTYENCTFRNASLLFLTSTKIKVNKCSFFKSNSDHSLQCDKCSDIVITNNYFEEPIGTSSVSDIVNMYKSNRALIQNNYLIGGGPSLSGGGIILGDNMGDNQEASNNICIDCGQYGIAIAGGRNNKIRDNIIMSKQYPWTNVGLYVWGIPQRNSRVDNAEVTGNRISWKRRNGLNNSMWISKQNVFGVIQRNNQINLEYSAPARPDGIGANTR